MARKNPHIGSSFESWLDKAGIREEVTAAAGKAVIARRSLAKRKKRKITNRSVGYAYIPIPRSLRASTGDAIGGAGCGARG